MCVLRTFLTNKVNNPKLNYKYSSSGLYYCPEQKNSLLESWIEYIKTLPEQDPPEIFGMHSNADISYQRSISDKYCNIIMLTLNDEGGDEEGGSDSEKIVNDILTK